MLAEECEPAGLVGGEELGKHQALEQFGEHGHGEQEAGLAGQPTLPIQGDAAARHDHVHERVMGHGRLVWSTAVMPMRTPRCSGSVAIVSTASEEALNSR